MFGWKHFSQFEYMKNVKYVLFWNDYWLLVSISLHVRFLFPFEYEINMIPMAMLFVASEIKLSNLNQYNDNSIFGSLLVYWNTYGGRCGSYFYSWCHINFNIGLPCLFWIIFICCIERDCQLYTQFRFSALIRRFTIACSMNVRSYYPPDFKMFIYCFILLIMLTGICPYSSFIVNLSDRSLIM